jgi:hypothetical protein
MFLIFIIFMLSWTIFDENNKNGVRVIKRLPVEEIIQGLDVNIPFLPKADNDRMLDGLQSLLNTHRYGKGRFADITITQIVGNEDFDAIIRLHRQGHQITFKNHILNQKWLNYIIDNIPQKTIIEAAVDKVVKLTTKTYNFAKRAISRNV